MELMSRVFLSKTFCKLYLFLVLIGVSVHLYSSEPYSFDHLNGDVSIKAKGDFQFPPFEFVDKDGNYDGFNVELFRALMSRLGLNYTLELDDWTTIRDELSKDSIDLLIGMTFSNERSKTAFFGMPHSMIKYCIVTRKGKKVDGIQSLKGKSVIVQNLDQAHERLMSMNIADTLIITQTAAEALNLLASGKYDAAIVFEVVARSLIDEYNLHNLKTHYADMPAESYSIVVNTNNIQLLHLLNAELFQMKLDGEYDRIYSKWFNIYERRDIYKIIRIMLICIILIFLIVSVFIWQLRKRIKQATKELRNKNEEASRLVDHLQLEIEQREKMEADLIKAKERAEQSDKLKMAFLANMSHEIRTPLNSIIGFSEMIQYAEDEAERDEYIKIIKRNNEMLLRLIGDILDLSKIESGAIEIKNVKVDIVPLLSEAFKAMESRNENQAVTMRAEYEIDKCVTLIDSNRLLQVVNNFLSNAMKYTQHGEIVMRVDYVNSGVFLTVQDAGMGIEESKQHLIFQRFEKLDSFAQGSGLGLSICKATIDALGGDIGFESVSGKGSTFWAWIPCKCAEE